MFDNDTKIDKLIDAYGWVGFGIWFYLCQKAYGSDGYYYRWGFADCASTARKMGGGIGSGTVKEVVGYCLQIGLFDNRVFDRWGVLTSRGIQRRYCVAAAERKMKNVVAEYWLLSDEESAGFIKCALNAENPTADGNSLPVNSIKPPNNRIMRHKSKGKESRVKDSKDDVDARARDGGDSLLPYLANNLTHMSPGNYAQMRETMAAGMTDELVRYAVDIACSRNIRTWAYVQRILDDWICEGISTVPEAKAEAERKKGNAANRRHTDGGARGDRPRATSSGEEIL